MKKEDALPKDQHYHKLFKELRGFNEKEQTAQLDREELERLALASLYNGMRASGDHEPNREEWAWSAAPFKAFCRLLHKYERSRGLCLSKDRPDFSIETIDTWDGLGAMTDSFGR